MHRVRPCPNAAALVVSPSPHLTQGVGYSSVFGGSSWSSHGATKHCTSCLVGGGRKGNIIIDRLLHDSFDHTRGTRTGYFQATSRSQWTEPSSKGGSWWLSVKLVGGWLGLWTAATHTSLHSTHAARRLPWPPAPVSGLGFTVVTSGFFALYPHAALVPRALGIQRSKIPLQGTV